MSEQLSFDRICRRAGGRRRYNGWRQMVATLRRLKAAQKLRAYPPLARGVAAATVRIDSRHRGYL